MKLTAVNADTEISGEITSRVCSKTEADLLGLDENNLPVYRDITIKQRH